MLTTSQWGAYAKLQRESITVAKYSDANHEPGIARNAGVHQYESCDCLLDL